jgi:hypothetical protein
MQRAIGSCNGLRNLCAGVFAVFLSLSLMAVIPAGAQEIGWPRALESSGQRIELFQPQVQSWRNGKLDACVAVNVAGPEAKEPVYGVLWFSARTSVDEAQRQVTLYDLEVTKAEFPSDSSHESDYAAIASQAVSQWTFSIALDRLLADMAVNQSQTAGAAALNTTPPRIYIRENPAVLILIDGNPVLRQVENSELQRIINTPALIVLDPKTNTYFLRGDGYWVKASALTGPWTQAANPPASLDDLLANEPQAVPAAVPQSPPEVIVSTVPAELIQFQGRPQFSPILGTQLLYITNTDSDLFLRVPERQYYVLLSGRWFRAQNLNGSWQFVSASDLPPDFAKIPPDHPKAGVLASVPGTREARAALAAAEVPQTATVNRKLATFTPTYDGGPQFAPIAGTDLAYAVNSPDNIIRVGDRYYAVSDGVWFVANIPTGPWIVCDSVPQEIYTIPPSSPVYPVTYVYVYDSTPDYVYVGYLPGYFGVYVWDGLVVYGTGFYYPCWAGLYYYGWPWTWGFGFQYTYWGGGFYWRPWYRPGWYWHRPWHYGPRPGPWLKADQRILYNRSVHRDPRATRTTLQNRSVYNRWQSPAVTSHPPLSLRSQPRHGIPVTISPQRAVPKAPDVYGGPGGGVYMHRSDGWYRRDGGNWTKMPVPPGRAPTTGLHRPPGTAPTGRAPTAPAPSRPAPPTTAPPRTAPPRTAPPTHAPPRPSAPRPGPRHEATLQQLDRQRQARSQGANLVRQFQRQISAPSRPAGRPRHK